MQRKLNNALKDPLHLRVPANEPHQPPPAVKDYKRTHRLLQRQPLLIPQLLLQPQMRSQRRTARLFPLQEPVDLIPLTRRKLNLLPPLLDPPRVPLQLLHEDLDLVPEPRLTRLLGVSFEGYDTGEDDLGEGDGSGEGAVVLGEDVNELVGESVGVDARLLVRGRAAEVVFEIEGFKSRRLGALGEIGRVEDFEEGGGEGDVGAGALDDAEEGADEVESERVVAGGGDEAGEARVSFLTR